MTVKWVASAALSLKVHVQRLCTETVHKVWSHLGGATCSATAIRSRRVKPICAVVTRACTVVTLCTPCHNVIIQQQCNLCCLIAHSLALTLYQKPECKDCGQNGCHTNVHSRTMTVINTKGSMHEVSRWFMWSLTLLQLQGTRSCI